MNFLHTNIHVNSKKQQSSQGSVFYVKMDEAETQNLPIQQVVASNERVLKIVSLQMG